MVNVYLQYASGTPIPLRKVDHLELINLRRDLRAAARDNAPPLRGASGGDLALALQAVEHECDRRFDEATVGYRARRQPNGDQPPSICRVVKPGTHNISAAIGTVYSLQVTDKTKIYLFNEQLYVERPSPWRDRPDRIPVEGETVAGALILTEDERLKAKTPWAKDRTRWVSGYADVLKVIKPHLDKLGSQCTTVLYRPLVEQRPFPQVPFPTK